MTDDWTVAKVEEVMWRIRAAGGTDDTPVDGITEITVTTPIFLGFVERPDGDDPRAGREIPGLLSSPPLPRGLRVGAQAVGVLVAIPAVGIPAVYAWSWFLDLLNLW